MNFLRVFQVIALETMTGFIQTSAALITSLFGTLFLLDAGPLSPGSLYFVIALAIGYMLDFTFLTGIILACGSFATSILLITSAKPHLSDSRAECAAVLFLVFLVFGIRQRLVSAAREDGEPWNSSQRAA